MGRSPQNKWMEAFVAAHHVNTDRQIIVAASGDSVSADENLDETLIALPAGQKIAASGSGLTFPKIRDAKEILDAATVPYDERHAVISPAQDNDLLNIQQATGQEYIAKRVLEKGTLDGEFWMGFRWRVSNELSKSGSDRLCLFYQKMAIGLWVPMDVRSHLAPDPGRSFDTAMLVEMSCSATRTQDEGVVQVACQE
jgi:hypothetical protein